MTDTGVCIDLVPRPCAGRAVHARARRSGAPSGSAAAGGARPRGVAADVPHHVAAPELAAPASVDPRRARLRSRDRTEPVGRVRLRGRRRVVRAEQILDHYFGGTVAAAIDGRDTGDRAPAGPRRRTDGGGQRHRSHRRDRRCRADRRRPVAVARGEVRRRRIATRCGHVATSRSAPAQATDWHRRPAGPSWLPVPARRSRCGRRVPADDAALRGSAGRVPARRAGAFVPRHAAGRQHAGRRVGAAHRGRRQDGQRARGRPADPFGDRQGDVAELGDRPGPAGACRRFRPRRSPVRSYALCLSVVPVRAGLRPDVRGLLRGCGSSEPRVPGTSRSSTRSPILRSRRRPGGASRGIDRQDRSR